MTNYERILVEEQKIEQDYIEMREMATSIERNHSYLAATKDIILRIESRERLVDELMKQKPEDEYRPDVVELIFGIGEF